MRNNKAARPAATAAILSDVVPLVALYVDGLDELAALGICNKECRTAVKQCIRENVSPLLIALVQRSHDLHSGKKQARQRWEATLRWLLDSADAFPATAVGPILLLPSVPQFVIAELMKRGLEFSYHQLIAAARYRVVGVERWVKQLMEMKLMTDVPEVIEDITCPSKFGYLRIEAELLHLAANDIADVLHIAFNLESSTSALPVLQALLTPQYQEAKRVVRDLMTPRLLQELMLTAALRGHYAAVTILCSFPAVDQLDAAAVKMIFCTAIQYHNCDKDTNLLTTLLVPELNQYLTPDIILELLEVAVKCGRFKAIQLLCTLEGTKHVTSDQLQILLEAALSGSGPAILEQLCQLPSAQLLSTKCISNCISSLCLMYSGQQSEMALFAVLRLTPAQSLTITALQSLLSTAVAVGNKKAAAGLLSLPAATELHAGDIFKLLQQFIHVYADTKSATPTVINVLLELPSATEICPTQALNIIKRASEASANHLLRPLCQKLVNLTTAGLLEVIQLGASQGTSSGSNYELHVEAEVLLKLLSAPPAQQLSTEQLMQLMPLVARQAGTGNPNHHKRLLLQTVCDLPAAQAFAAGELHQMLLFAIRERCKLLAQWLLTLPGAQSLTADDVGGLLCMTVKRSMPSVAECLCKLPSAHHMQSCVLEEALLMGMELKLDEHVLKSLCSLLLASIAFSSKPCGMSQHFSQTPCQQVVAVADGRPQPVNEQGSGEESRDSPTSKCQSHQQLLQQGSCSDNSEVSQTATDDLSMLDRVLDAAVQHRCLAVILEDMTQCSKAAGLFTNNRVQQLMHGAVEQGCVRGLRFLCDLPAAATVPASSAERMLRYAIQQDCTTILERLCRLPVVSSIPPEAAVQLLQQAQHQQSGEAIGILLKHMPATLMMSADCLVDLMEINLQFSEGSHVLDYMSAPAVQHCDVDQAAELLRASVMSAHYLLTKSLCDIVPAVQDIGTAAAEALLQLCITCSRRKSPAIHGKIDDALAALLHLPGVQQLSPAAVQELLTAALMHGCVPMIAHLMQLPAATDGLTAAQYSELSLIAKSHRK